MDEEQAGARRGRPPVSDQQRRRRRLEISREAVRLFRAHGLAATSGARIAQASGVSERTLWRLFRTKESCVEPLLTEALDGFCTVLRAWPEGVALAEHLRSSYTFVPDGSHADIEALLAVVRMSHDDPVLRAVWLVLQERAEPTFAEVLGPRTGQPPNCRAVLVHAATVNAALRVATDDLARAAAGGITPADMEEHRRLLAETLRMTATRGTAPPS